MPPWQGGGDMVKNVTFEKTTYNELPFKFEAGTTNFPGAIGLAAALKYLISIGRQEIAEAEAGLLRYATEKLSSIEGVKIYGVSDNKIPVISFLPEEIHQYDAGMVLDKMGIAVRTGTHCAQPVMDKLGIAGTIRASFSFYNTREEADRLAHGIKKVIEMFS
jgi:cysteine desulfurase/selenocysteine lyase